MTVLALATFPTEDAFLHARRQALAAMKYSLHNGESADAAPHT